MGKSRRHGAALALTVTALALAALAAGWGAPQAKADGLVKGTHVTFVNSAARGVWVRMFVPYMENDWKYLHPGDKMSKTDPPAISMSAVDCFVSDSPNKSEVRFALANHPFALPYFDSPYCSKTYMKEGESEKVTWLSRELTIKRLDDKSRLKTWEVTLHK